MNSLAAADKNRKDHLNTMATTTILVLCQLSTATVAHKGPRAHIFAAINFQMI